MNKIIYKKVKKKKVCFVKMFHKKVCGRPDFSCDQAGKDNSGKLLYL